MLEIFQVYSQESPPGPHLTLLVCRSAADPRSFAQDWRKALAWAKRRNPDEWNYTDVLDRLRGQGWDILTPAVTELSDAD